MIGYTKKISKELNGLNLNYAINGVEIKTYWCRLALGEKTTFNRKKHAHSFYELHLCLSGSARFEVEGKEYLLKEGQFALVPKKCPHQILEISEDFDKFVWGFDAQVSEQGEFCALQGKHLESFSLLDCSSAATALFTLLLECIKEQKTDYYAFVKLYLFGLLNELFKSVYLAKTRSAEEGKLSLKPSVERETVRRYVLDNLQSRVSVRDVAEQMAISERQLFRLFQQKYGVSAYEYVQQIQMEEAKRLLENTELSIEEIAEKTGYADRFSFSRAFEKYEGLTPAKFRAGLAL